MKKKLQQDLEEVEKLLVIYEDVNNVNSPSYYIREIEKVLKADNGWAYQDSLIKGNKKNSTVNLETIENIIKNKQDDDSIEEIEEQYNKLKKIYFENNTNVIKNLEEIKKYTIESDYESNIKKLLLEEIQENDSLTSREIMILDYIKNGKQSFYEEVKENFSQDVEICPYCLRDIYENYRKKLVNEIENILTDNISQYKKKLSDFILPNIDIEESYKNYNSEEYSILKGYIDKYNINKENVNKLVKSKLDNVYLKINNEDIEKVVFEEDIKNINESIENINENIKEVNIIISNKNSTKNKLSELLNRKYAIQIYQNYNKYNEFNKKKNDAEKDKSSKQTLIQDVEKNIMDLNSQKSNIKIAVGRINKFIEYIFFSKERLELKCIDNEYYVKVNGKDVELNKLSSGERNIIAIAYFFATMLEQQNEKDKFNKDSLIVLDDPISSVDFDNKVGIYTFLRTMFYEVITNSKSKIICFSHNLEVIYNLEKTFSDIGKVSLCIKELKNLELIDFKYKKFNERRIRNIKRQFNTGLIMTFKKLYFKKL